MEIIVYTKDGKEKERIALPGAADAVKVRPGLIHQVIVAMQENVRTSAAHSLTRKDIRGGGKKPWRQKGTGNARQGSIRAPQWRGGGVVFGPIPARPYGQKINKKMKQKAVAMALVDKIRNNQLIAVDDFGSTITKTKHGVDLIAGLQKVCTGLQSSSHRRMGYFLSAQPSGALFRSFRNIPGVRIDEARNMTIRDIVQYPYVVVEQGAIGELVRYFQIS